VSAIDIRRTAMVRDLAVCRLVSLLMRAVGWRIVGGDPAGMIETGVHTSFGHCEGRVGGKL
jgi:hypothetical protein